MLNLLKELKKKLLVNFTCNLAQNIEYVQMYYIIIDIKNLKGCKCLTVEIR